MKRIIASLLCIVLALGSLSGCGGQAAGNTNTGSSTSGTAEKKTISYNELDETDQKMLQTISSLHKVCNENPDEIWGGLYKPQNLPMLMVRTNENNGTETAHLFSFNIEKFDDDMQPSTLVDIPTDLGLENVFYLPFVETNSIEKGLADGFNFDFYELQGIKGMYVKYYEGMDMARCIELLTHEGFHEFYQVANWKNVNDLQSAVEMDDEKYTEDLVTLEMMISVMLQKSMSVTDESELKSLMVDILTLRNYVYDKYPIRKPEMQSETIEGSAQDVYYRIENMIKGVAPLDAELLPDFDTNFHATVEQWMDEQYKPTIKLAFYKDLYYDWGVASIAAMTRLGYEYRDGIDHDSKLVWDYLMQYFMPDGCTYTEADIEQLKTKYGYNEYVNLAKYWTENLNTEGKIINQT